jgi:diacylglycerol O-acyltransferase
MTMRSERLSALDAGFLEAEDSDRHASLAIGAVAVLEGPPPEMDSFVSTIEERVRRIPRCTQVLRSHAWDLSAPEWVHDDSFDVRRHVRRTAVARPGDDAALFRVVADLMERRLDRGRPLWECWLIDGLDDSRWALVVKVHHSVADGVAASTMLAAMCDGQAATEARVPVLHDPSGPGGGVRLPDLNPVSWLTGAWNASLTTARTAWRLSTGAAEIATGIVSPAPQAMTGALTDLRRYGAARVSLADVKTICHRFDVTVNDVALAAITDSFREAMLRRGEPIRPSSLRTLVPVSLRKPDEQHIPDNRVSVMLPLLPVELDDPLQRLRTVHGRLTKSKSSGQSQPGGLVVAVSNWLPFAVTAWTVRLLTRLPQRGVVTVATNVPGPSRPVSVMGRPVLSLMPIPPIAMHLRLGIAITSYADELSFGVIGDFDATVDAQEIASGIEDGVRLVTVTRACQAIPAIRKSAAAPHRLIDPAEATTTGRSTGSRVANTEPRCGSFRLAEPDVLQCRHIGDRPPRKIPKLQPPAPRISDFPAPPPARMTTCRFHQQPVFGRRDDLPGRSHGIGGRSCHRERPIVRPGARHGKVDGGQPRAITTALVSDLDPVAAPLQMIAERVCDLTDAEQVIVLVPGDSDVVPEEIDTLVVSTAVGVLSDEVVGQRIPVDGSTSGGVFRSGEPLITESFRHPIQAFTDVGHRPAIVMPLRAQQSVLGILAVARNENDTPFDASDLDLVSDFADHAAVALSLSASREQARELSVTNDRERIAHDLHDHVIQRLFAAGMDLQGTISRSRSPEITKRLRRTVDDLQGTIDEIRTTIFALQSRTEAAGGFRQQIQNAITELTDDRDIETTVRISGPLTAVGEELAEQATPAIVEAVSNAVRHSGAAHLTVEVHVADDITIDVTDDGCGIDPNNPRRSGLANLHRRAELAGGSCEVGAAAGGGTHIRWAAPLRGSSLAG